VLIWARTPSRKGRRGGEEGGGQSLTSSRCWYAVTIMGAMAAMQLMSMLMFM